MFAASFQDRESGCDVGATKAADTVSPHNGRGACYRTCAATHVRRTANVYGISWIWDNVFTSGTATSPSYRQRKPTRVRGNPAGTCPLPSSWATELRISPGMP